MNPNCVEDTENIPSRRVVLRGALAAGGSLCLPIALLGCDAKKDGAAGGTDSNAAPPPTAKKLAPASVQYQAQPKGDLKCSGCAHFIVESSTCKLVDGPISPEGWCAVWLKKA